MNRIEGIFELIKNDVYYHITPHTNVSKILRKGLVPGQPETCGYPLSSPEHKEYIHLGKNKELLQKWFRSEFPNIKKWVILKVNTKGLDLKSNLDYSKKQWFMTKDFISKDRITVEVRG